MLTHQQHPSQPSPALLSAAAAGAPDAKSARAAAAPRAAAAGHRRRPGPLLQPAGPGAESHDAGALARSSERRNIMQFETAKYLCMQQSFCRVCRII